jgi:hypothetical protein
MDGKDAEAREAERVTRWWVNLCFVVGGVGCDWYCAFSWFNGNYSAFAAPVLRRAVLIVLLCSLVSVFVARIAKGRLRDSSAVFFVLSAALLGNLLTWWMTHR